MGIIKKNRRIYQKKRIQFPFLLILLFLILFTLPVFYGKESYREWLLSGVNQSSGMKIDYINESLIFFPYPGIRLHDVSIYKNYVLTSPITKAQSITFFVSWKSIYSGKIIFSKVNFDGMEVSISRNKNGSFYILNNSFEASGKENSKGDWHSIFEKFNLEAISLQHCVLNFNDMRFYKKYKFFISDAEISKTDNDHWKGFSTGYINSPESILNINFEFRYPLMSISEDTAFSVKIKSVNFPALLLGDLLTPSFKTNFSNTNISGNYRIEKTAGNIITGEIDAKIKGLALKGGTAFSEMFFKGDIEFDTAKMQMIFKKSVLNWPSHGYLFGNGIIYIKTGLPMTFNIYSIHGNFHSILDLIQVFRFRFQNSDSGDDRYATRLFNLDLKRVFGYENRFETIKGQVMYNAPIMLLNNLRMTIYKGNIEGNGSVDFRDYSFRYTAEASGINVQDLIKNYTDAELISGKLSSNIKILTTVNSEPEFFTEMKARGKFKVSQGELIGYANATKAIASVGKLLNVLGPSGKSTAFEYITSDFTINNNAVKLSDLNLKGVGLDANAKGKIGLDSSIDMRVTLSLGGPVGTVLKIPVIYSGTINKDQPYIDPVWVTSVAVGSTFAFPANPVQGVMVGSFVSDYIRDFFDLFGSNDEKGLEEIDSPIRDIE